MSQCDSLKIKELMKKEDNKTSIEEKSEALLQAYVSKSAFKFEYGFESVNGIVKKKYYLHEIPNIKEKCDVWNVLPIVEHIFSFMQKT